MSEKPTSPSRAAQKQLKHREGVAARLDALLAEQREQRQQIAVLPEIQARLDALVALLGIELTRVPTQERRPR